LFLFRDPDKRGGRKRTLKKGEKAKEFQTGGDDLVRTSSRTGTQ